MRALHSLRLGLGVSAVWGLCACGRAADPKPAAPPTSRPVPALEPEVTLVDERISELTVRTQGVSFSFPGAEHFGPEVRVGSWTTLRHARTGGTLYILHRPARRTVTPAECEQQATLSLRLLREPLAEIWSEGVFRARDYFGTSSIGVRASHAGQVVVHAAGLARCLSLVFSDPGGREQGALGLVADDFFPTVRALSVDARARLPEPP